MVITKLIPVKRYTLHNVQSGSHINVGHSGHFSGHGNVITEQLLGGLRITCKENLLTIGVGQQCLPSARSSERHQVYDLVFEGQELAVKPQQVQRESVKWPRRKQINTVCQ